MNKKRFKFKKSELLFIIITVACFSRKIGTYTDTIWITNAKALSWIILSFCIKDKNTFINNKVNNHIYKKIFPLFYKPYIYMISYTLIIWFLFGTDGSGSFVRYITRLGSNFLWLFIMVIYSYRAMKVFGEKAFDLMALSLVISYLVFAVIPALLTSGLIEIFRFATMGTNTTHVASWLEVNDVSFALGVVAVVYLIKLKKKTLDNYKALFGIMILIFFGGKRIEFLAIAVAFVYYLIFIKHFNSKLVYKVSLVTVMATSTLFFILIYSGMLDALALKYGINFNFRIDTWHYWANRSSFSPMYLGKGSSFVDKETFLLVRDHGIITNGYVLLNGMHSDLFKKYVELGFVGCYFWLYYIVYYRIKKIDHLFGREVGLLTLSITLYNFVLYFTDNTFDYLDSNVVTMAAICAMAVHACSETKKKETTIEVCALPEGLRNKRGNNIELKKNIKKSYS